MVFAGVLFLVILAISVSANDLKRTVIKGICEPNSEAIINAEYDSGGMHMDQSFSRDADEFGRWEFALRTDSGEIILEILCGSEKRDYSVVAGQNLTVNFLYEEREEGEEEESVEQEEELIEEETEDNTSGITGQAISDLNLNIDKNLLYIGGIFFAIVVLANIFSALLIGASRKAIERRQSGVPRASMRYPKDIKVVKLSEKLAKLKEKEQKLAEKMNQVKESPKTNDSVNIKETPQEDMNFKQDENFKSDPGN